MKRMHHELMKKSHFQSRRKWGSLNILLSKRWSATWSSELKRRPAMEISSSKPHHNYAVMSLGKTFHDNNSSLVALLLR